MEREREREKVSKEREEKKERREKDEWNILYEWEEQKVHRRVATTLLTQGGVSPVDSLFWGVLVGCWDGLMDDEFPKLALQRKLTILKEENTILTFKSPKWFLGKTSWSHAWIFIFSKNFGRKWCNQKFSMKICHFNIK